MPSSGRPWTLSVSTSAKAQPMAAAARLKAPATGSTRISAAGKRRARVAPMPNHIGSPLASTTTLRPRQPAIASMVGSMPSTQVSRCAGDAGIIAWWRSPPTRSSAAATREAAAADRLASPLSPMPITHSHGGAVMGRRR